MPDFSALVSVFEEIEALRPVSDDLDQEIQAVLETLRQERLPSGMETLFLPTGPLQEASLDEGWGDEFCALADRFDAAMAVPCICVEVPSARLELVTNLGIDAHHAEAQILRCPACGQLWLRYLVEDEAFSSSGRWYLGRILREVSLRESRDAFATMNSYFRGGSYFSGAASHSSGAIF